MDNQPTPSPLVPSQRALAVTALQHFVLVEEYGIIGCNHTDCRVAIKYGNALKHLKKCHPRSFWSDPGIQKFVTSHIDDIINRTQYPTASKKNRQQFWLDFDSHAPVHRGTFFGNPQDAWACPSPTCKDIFSLRRNCTPHILKAHKNDLMQFPWPHPIHVQAIKIAHKELRLVKLSNDSASHDPDLDEFLLAVRGLQSLGLDTPTSHQLPTLPLFYKQLNWFQDRDGMTPTEWQIRLQSLVKLTSPTPTSDIEASIVNIIDQWHTECFANVTSNRWPYSLRDDLMRPRIWSDYERDNVVVRPFAKLTDETEQKYKLDLKRFFLYLTRRYALPENHESQLAIHGDHHRSTFLTLWLDSIPTQHDHDKVNAFQAVMFFFAARASELQHHVLSDYTRDAQAINPKPSQGEPHFELAAPAGVCKRISGFLHMFRLAVGTEIFNTSATCYEPNSTKRTSSYDNAMRCAHGEAPQTPVHALRDVSNTVWKFLNQTLASVKVVWTSNPLTGDPMDGLAIGGDVVRLATIQQTARDTLEELGNLVDNLLPGLSRAAFPVITAPDNLELKLRGYSYFDDLTVNVSGPRGVTTVNTMQHAFNFARDQGLIDPGPILTEHLAFALAIKSRAFVRLLMAFIHMTQSMPARAPEMCDVLIRNDDHLRRQLFFVAGQLVVRRTHSKADTVKQEATSLVHWWTHSLSEIVVHYLAYIRPLELFALTERRRHNRDDPAANNDPDDTTTVARTQLFHFMGQRITPDMYRDAFTDLARRFMGDGTAHFSHWRHITQALACSKLVDTSGAKLYSILTSLLAMSANHSANTAKSTYGISNLDIPGIATADLNVMRIVCNVFAQFMLGPPRHGSTPDNSLLNAIPAPSHGSEESSLVSSSSFPAAASSWAFWNREPQKQPTNFDRNTFQHATHYAKKYLHKYLACAPHDATFKSPQQALATYLTLERKADVLVKLPVGAGKTLVALLPALVEMESAAGITLLIEPLLAMESQIVSECRNRNITVATWSSNSTASQIHPAKGVLVLSPETFSSADFQNILHGAVFSNRISRIVVDEAHLCHMWGNFRDCMKDIGSNRPTHRQGNVRRFVPLVALTGTCPGFLQANIMRHLNIAGPNLVIVDQPTRNTTTKFVSELFHNSNSLHKDGATPWIDFVCSQVLSNIDNSIPNRAIFYVTKRADAKIYTAYAISKYPALHPQEFTGDLDSRTKASLYRSWQDRKVNVLFCTTAFGLGVDDPTCTLVVRIGLGRSTMGVIQESGRCGRAGGKSMSITLVDQHESLRDSSQILEKADNVTRKDFERLPPGFLGHEACLGATLADFLELPVASSLPCMSHPNIDQWTYCTVCELGGPLRDRSTKYNLRESNFAAAKDALTGGNSADLAQHSGDNTASEYSVGQPIVLTSTTKRHRSA